MDQALNRSILDAIEQGRGQRGRTNPQAWSRHRAKVLTAAQQGLPRIRIGGELGLSEGHVNVLFDEACDAVLRGGAVSDAAESVCAYKWRRWCENGDAAACDRLRRL